MPVNVDQFKVDPYQSTVPLVQIPPDAISAQTRPDPPLQGNFTRKGTGALAIGDSLLKGFMLGHQQKEQKKQAQAQATINAADAASEAAYTQYQDALTKAGGKQDDPGAKAAYDAYISAFQSGKQAKAQFVIPEKGQKGKKAAGDTDPVKSPDDKKKKTASAGFNNIKDFFEANPHIVPQIALMTMQPKPPGISAQGQEQVQSLESQRLGNEEKSRKLQNEKTYQDGFSTYAHLSPEEIAALPPEAKKGYESWQNSRAALAPMKYTGATRLYKLGNGKKAWLYPEEAAQYYPDAEALGTTGELKPGTEAYFQTRYATENGIDPSSIPSATSQYLHEYWAWKQQYGPTTTSSSTTDPQGNRTTTTRKGAPPPPQPPPGVTPISEPGITPPPQGAKAASGGIGRPPTAGASSSGQEQPLTAGTGKPGSPLNPYPNPEDQPGATSYEFNKSWAKPGPYLTKLSPEDEVKFQKWMKDNPGVVDQKDLDNPQSGYDTRGWWQAGEKGDPSAKRVRNAWDGKMHSSDKWKTPYNGTFSNESLYAMPGAPRWKGDKLTTSDGRVVADETPKPRGTSKGGIAPPPQAGKTAQASAKTGIAAPPKGKETALTASVTRQAVKAQQQGYQKAETAYSKAIADADKAFASAQKTAASSGDQSILATAQAAKDRAYARATLDREDAKAAVATEYDAAVKSIGGTPGSQGGSSEDNPPQGATARVKDANGKLIGWAVNGQFVPLGQ